MPISWGQPVETQANTEYVLRNKGGGLSLEAIANRLARVGLASWWGKGPPRRRSIAGLRG